MLVTDSGLTEEAREELAASVGELIVTETPGRARSPSDETYVTHLADGRELIYFDRRDDADRGRSTGATCRPAPPPPSCATTR